MKFLLIVLLILLLGELIANKIKNKDAGDDDKMLIRSKHPAEYDLR